MRYRQYKEELPNRDFLVRFKDGTTQIINGPTTEQAFLNAKLGPDKAENIDYIEYADYAH